MSNTTHKHIITLILFVTTSAIGCYSQFKMHSVLALEDSELIFTCGVRAELKRGSEIRHPFPFSGQNTNFILSGEASFQVLTGFRLTVEYNGIVIKATGASFSVTKGNGIIEVTVLKSEIIMLANKQQIVVRAFQRATYNISTEQITIVDTMIKRT